MLREKYKELFNIDDEDYKKAKEYYDTYLGVFDSLLKADNDSSKYEEIKGKIEGSNPWKENLEKDEEYQFKKEEYIFRSLAETDRKILEPLLIKNIETLKGEGKDDAKKIIEARFEHFEQAFDGNFIDPKVIIMGINPKMSATHDSYGLEKTVYIEPFNSRRPILQNDYYFKNSGIFYAKMKNYTNLKKEHMAAIVDESRITPVALWEFFPYASEKESEWQRGYNISDELKKYFQLKKILPSQIWMVCLLTYTIKLSSISSKGVRLFLRKNNKQFRNNFLLSYFETLGVENNEYIEVLAKKSHSSKYLSRGNVKPFFNDQALKIKVDSVENFFEDLWGIENKD